MFEALRNLSILQECRVSSRDGELARIYKFKKYSNNLPDFLDKKVGKAAFTLAEVLITLGVIGVVAAMTMPSLIAKYQEIVFVNKAKKAMSTIQNALVLTRQRNGFDSNAEIFVSNAPSSKAADLLFPNLNVVKRCAAGDLACGESVIKRQRAKNDGFGNVAGPLSHRWPKVVLVDGTVIGVQSATYEGPDCTAYYTAYDKDKNGNYILDADGNKTGAKKIAEPHCGTIFFDVNGEKGPNQFGADAFYIYVTSQGYIQSEGLINDVLRTGKLTAKKYDENQKFNK